MEEPSCWRVILNFRRIGPTCGSRPAPALVLVGMLMMRNVVKINWKDYTEGTPAFLVIVGIPLCFSIADGIAWGFISYPLIKLFSGRGREASLLMYIMAFLFLLRYLLPFFGLI